MEKQAPSNNNICNFRILRSRRVPLPKQPDYPCQECPMQFKSGSELKSHVGAKHPKPKLSTAVMEAEAEENNHPDPEDNSGSGSSSTVSSPLVPILPETNLPKESLRQAHAETSSNLLLSPTVSASPAAAAPARNPPTLSDSIMELITPTCPPNDYWMQMPDSGDLSPVEYEPGPSTSSSTRRIGADFVNQNLVPRQGHVNSNGALICPICNELKPTKGSMDNHIDMHKGKKPFLCHVCGWAYETEMKLLEHHIHKHDMEPIFQCGCCGRKYKREGALQRHKCGGLNIANNANLPLTGTS